MLRPPAGRRRVWPRLIASTVAIGVLLGTAAGHLTLGQAAPNPSANASGAVPDGAFDILREMNSRLGRAIKKDLDGGKLRRETGQIDGLKETLIKRYLGDYYGKEQRICGVLFRDAFFRFEHIDTRLRDALIHDAQGDAKARENSIKAARGSVSFTESMLSGCRPPIPQDGVDLLHEMYNRLTRALRNDLDGRKLSKEVGRVENLKHELIKHFLGDQKVFGSSFWDFFEPLELIDLDLRDAVIYDIAGDEKRSKSHLRGAKSWKDLFEKMLARASANQPPSIASFKATFPGPTPTSTLYTVTASDPEGAALSYEWSKVPPPGSDPSLTNCGTFTPNFPAANQAVWDHPHPPCDPSVPHPGWITVVVSDRFGASTTYTYTDGSASSP